MCSDDDGEVVFVQVSVSFPGGGGVILKVCENKAVIMSGDNWTGIFQKMKGMKMRMRNLGLAVLFISGLAASGIASAGSADFTLVNKTGYALREVYLSPAHKTKWGNDRLGQDTLENNKSRLFKFSDKSSCVQDLLVIFDDDGSEVTWEDFDLCALNKITLKYNRKSKVVSADTE